MQSTPLLAIAFPSMLEVSELLGGTGVGHGQGLREAGPDQTTISKYGLCNAIRLYVPADTLEQYLSSFQCHSRILVKN